jgi:PIN domain nuclease of toxin-antitoxin system
VRVLLDTRACLGWIQGGDGLSPAAKRTIAEVRNECWLSLASVWEMAITISLGKPRLPGDLDRFLPEQLLVAQALEDGFSVVSADRVFSKYNVRRIW